MQDELYHHGIKGMHWGVRKPESQKRLAREKKEAKKSAHEAHKTEARNLKTKRKSVQAQRREMRIVNDERIKSVKKDRLEANRNRALLSDAELNQRINRLQKERQLNLLTQQELQPGRYAVKNALANVGTEVLKNEARSTVKKLRKNAPTAINSIGTSPRNSVGSASRVIVSK